jgi:hypothetical protein
VADNTAFPHFFQALAHERILVGVQLDIGAGFAGSGVAVSPDGRWILYTPFDQAGSELMLVENFR